MKKRKFSNGGYTESDDAKNLIAAAERERKEYERSQMSDEPGATESLRTAAARMGADKPKSMTPGKNPIVTKEQMKKAGFDNLRDYLNAQRGLTRRGSKGPSGQDIDRLEAATKASAIRDERRAYEQKQDAEAAAKRAADMQKERAAYMKEQARKKEDTQTGSQRLARKAEAFRTRMREQAGGMKTGGQVKSSASKRADGCAVRGKTRGKVM